MLLLGLEYSIPKFLSPLIVQNWEIDFGYYVDIRKKNSLVIAWLQEFFVYSDNEELKFLLKKLDIDIKDKSAELGCNSFK